MAIEIDVTCEIPILECPKNSRMGSGVERRHLKAINTQQLESYYNVLLPLKNDSHPPLPFLYSDVIVNARQPSSRIRGLLVLVLTFVVYY